MTTTGGRSNEDIDIDAEKKHRPSHNKIHDVVFDAIQIEYKNMASWYDRFWKPYTEATLKLPLQKVMEEITKNQNRVTTTQQVGGGGSDPTTVSSTSTSTSNSTKYFTLVDVGCGTGVLLRRLLDDIVVGYPNVVTDNNNTDFNIDTQQRSSDDDDGDGTAATTKSPIKLIGIEPSPEMLSEARKKFQNLDNAEHSSIVQLEQSPGECLPLDDGCADTVVSTNAFHFFRQKEKSLQEMKRVLKKDGGTLIVTDWCYDYLIVKLYHLLERIRWNWIFWGWRFQERYPPPLTSSEMFELVKSAGFRDIRHTKYQVRIFSVVFWGMQTTEAKRR